MNTRLETSRYLSFTKALLGRGIHLAYTAAIDPKTENEDTRRREFILNTILSCIIPLLVILDVFIDVATHKTDKAYRGIPFLAFTGIVLAFVWLLVLSRKGHYKTASFILLIVYFLADTYGAIHWGVELPLVAISYVVIIIISSILISTRFAFVMTGIIALTIITITKLQISGIIHPLLYWKMNQVRINDPIELSVVFFAVTAISWLSNREIETSLFRARSSEKTLKEERDQLEITVEKRTQEIKEMQNEKISQLYRFAEFGRLSSGVFHDLMNSLHSVVMNMGRLEQTPDNVPAVQEHLDMAVAASRRMGNYIEKVRKQISAENITSVFSLEEEIDNALAMLRFKAQESSVTITRNIKQCPIMLGNALKFYQVILNLVGNAIEACEEHAVPGKVNVVLDISLDKKDIIIRIEDNGPGIPEELYQSIFTPFFSTKSDQKGIGLGLSQTKEIIEQDFNGTIAVSSNNRLTVFTITLPYETSYAHKNLNSENPDRH